MTAACRDDYIRRNGLGNSCNDPIANPFQPADGLLIPFGGQLGNATIPRNITLQQYPLIQDGGLSATVGYSDYHALQLNVGRSFHDGLQFNANYVWSKSLDFNQSEAQTNGFADNFGYQGGQLDLRDLDNNRRPAPTDVSHRFVLSFLYELPFGRDKPFAANPGLVSAIVGGWRLAGAYVLQSGTPLAISGVNSGSANGRSIRAEGVPLEVPTELQGWYDGDTTVTLPSGRQITPCANCFLKYNPDACQGNVLQLPDGTFVSDIFWFGDAATSYTDVRSNGINNLNLSLEVLPNTSTISIRALYPTLLVPQRRDRIHPGGAASWQVACERRNCC
ncbi:MAG: hypothetical protein GEU99_18975 [Luteitalea sp.]|nr:hypothetical protein [Luteitalea sp.]